MAQQGDVFDLGTNEYMEFIEEFDDLHDVVIHYTREPAPSLGELKIHKLVKKGSLEEDYRKVGPNEKNRLLVVYGRATVKTSPELKAVLENRKDS